MSTLDSINTMIFNHAAWKNDFFDRASNGLSPDELRPICLEYLYFTKSFPHILSHLVARMDDGTRFHLVSILYSEQGSDSESRAHANLFRRLCRNLGVSDAEMSSPPKCPQTKQLVDGLERLFRDAPQLESMGAQYALEFQADNMLHSFRRAFAELESRSGHASVEGMEFFTVHDTEEPQHIAAMRQALVRLMKPGDINLVRKGARECLDLFANFWTGLTFLLNE